MSFEDKLEKIIAKFEELNEKLQDVASLSSDEYIQMSKERSDLEILVEKINNYKKAKEEFADYTEILKDETQDAEFRSLAEEEKIKLEKLLPDLERAVKIALLPKDEADDKNAILEIRAGAGGEEAALFASVLFRMYQRFAERNNWKVEILSLSDTGLGGFKEVQARITGKGVFSRLKFETGVHRVQRVPETESSGRIHTSTATVAVLPEAEEIDIKIEQKDLRIDVFRSSGPGGQSVNTTDSAVRIVHIPTGIVVQMQNEKSQHKNKDAAMKILRSRIYEMERNQKEAERSKERKEQVGTGDRSERIRTYNYHQGRVSDHRINMTLYKIDEILNNGEIEELVEGLISEDQAQKLAADI